MDFNKTTILSLLRQKILSAPLKVISSAIFGSFLSDSFTEQSDIDLLIVSANLNPVKHKRARDIAKIKTHLLTGIPLDILLLTPQECESNFKNHNPLFLDIATEGIILTDHNGYLINLINETKKYIDEHGIINLADGWQFPVKFREPTYLSQISNKDFEFAMLKDGERDFKIADTLIKEGFFDKAIYHLQQSTEKAIKGILICFGEFKKSHFVGETLILKLATLQINDSWRKRLGEIARINLGIEPEVTWSRYPGIDNGKLWLPAEEYTIDDALEVKSKSELILTTAREFITWWFHSIN